MQGIEYHVPFTRGGRPPQLPSIPTLHTHLLRKCGHELKEGLRYIARVEGIGHSGSLYRRREDAGQG